MNIVNLIKDYRGVVIEQIPHNVRDLLYEIEDFAKVKVGFRDISLLQQAATAYQVDVPSIEVESIYADHEQAYITLPDPACVNANAVLHELLHLHRYWVEAIPQLEAYGNNGPNVGFASYLDNELEHLVIVPNEKDYGYNPEPYWSSLSRDYWSRYPWGDVSPDDRRVKTLMGWLHSSLTSLSVRSEVETNLNRLEVFQEAERFRQRIHELLSSKSRATSAVLRFLKVPYEAMQMATLDIRNKKKLVSKVPAH